MLSDVEVSLLKHFLTLVLALMLSLITGCSLTTPEPTPMPTPDLPQVRFLFPENSTQIYEGSEILVDILAEDTSSGIVKIELLVDGVKINEGVPAAALESFRVQMNWIATGVGGHTLRAIAYRADGTPSIELPGTNLILAEVVPAPTP